jgi:hypothetical protein
MVMLKWIFKEQEGEASMWLETGTDGGNLEIGRGNFGFLFRIGWGNC